MVKRGLSKADEPTAFTDEELIKYFGSLVRAFSFFNTRMSLKLWHSQFVGNYSGTNSRARANHSRSLGWNPKLSSADMVASIDAEVEAILKQQK